MAYFTQAEPGSTLFLGQPSAAVGYVAAVFPQAPPQNAYDIPDVLGSNLNASIVFLQQPIGTGSAAQSAFVKAVADLIAAQPSGDRVIAWAVSPTTVPQAFVATLGPGSGSSALLSTALTVYGATSAITLTVPGQQQLQGSDDGLTLNWTTPPIVTGLANNVYAPLTIPFDGPNAFCIQMTMSVTQAALDARNFGFAFAMPSPVPNAANLLLYAPLTSPDGAQTPIFDASFDPLDLVNALNPDRTVLAFRGTNVETTTTQFTSCYTSPTGVPIALTPVVPSTAAGGDVTAKLVFVSLKYSNDTPAIFMLVPEGDFVLSIASGAPQLMCGLQGTEYLAFTPSAAKVAGDRLRFTSGAPAYAPLFPFPLASPTAAPFDPTASPLTPAWTTAYATLRQPAGGEPAPPRFVAQPPGFELFGVGGTIDPAAHPKLLGSIAPGTQIGPNPAHPFPLVPYRRVGSAGNATTMSPQQAAAYEAGILAPLRSAAVAQDALAPSGPTTKTWLVTPSGFLVKTKYNVSTGTATWSKILLGTVGSQQIAFSNPDPVLVSAFSSGSLMLVIANTAHTGAFQSTLTIGDWGMTANVNGPDVFGDYRNIVIVKGTTGALSDLVANPANWTNPAAFAAPDTGNGPDVSQLVNVSQWLQTYIAQAAAVTGPDAAYFAEFNALAQDPGWTGVLILRADITAIPSDIAGIVAGITDFSHFNAHHLAIPLAPAIVPTHPMTYKQSPVSGLIYYNPFPSDDPSQAVPTDPLGQYGFQLNSLKVTFQNSAVQTFSSYAQITLRSMLGSAVASSTAGYDSAVLTGTYQLVAGQPVYSLANSTETTFAMACAVLPAIDITGVQMSTISAVPNGNTTSLFAIAGDLDFAVLPGPVTDPVAGTIDIFSFGSTAGGTPGGLVFQNLLLTMTFPTPVAGKEPTSPVPATFALASDALRFDLGTSAVRAGSVVDQLSLQLTGLVQAASQTPAQLGYLPVIAMIPGGDLGPAWNGLVFNLDMGSPGQLAAKAGLTASLLLAWNPASDTAGTWDMQIGLQLPGTAQGAPLISLQTVLSLSIGQVSLQYALTADKTSTTYLLMLDEIALTFLGLLKFPPNGNTSFYLFGHPSSQQTALGWYARYVNTGDNA